MSSAQQGSPDRQQHQNTRREILAATDRFLRERPYRELSVDGLMAQVGLADTEFQRHFDDLTELVLSLLTDKGGELYGVAQRWLQESQTEQQADALNRAAHFWLQAIVHFFYRNGPLVRALSEAAITDERIERAYNDFLDRYTELTAMGLERMISEGRIEPLDPWPVARALNLMNERYLLDEFGHGTAGNPELALATLETIWLRALAPRVQPRAAG